MLKLYAAFIAQFKAIACTQKKVISEKIGCPTYIFIE